MGPHTGTGAAQKGTAAFRWSTGEGGGFICNPKHGRARPTARAEGVPAFPLGHSEIVPGTKRAFEPYCVHSNAPFPWRFLIRASVAPGLFILLKIKIYTPLVEQLKGRSERRNSIFNAF